MCEAGDMSKNTWVHVHIVWYNQIKLPIKCQGVCPSTGPDFEIFQLKRKVLEMSRADGKWWSTLCKHLLHWSHEFRKSSLFLVIFARLQTSHCKWGKMVIRGSFELRHYSIAEAKTFRHCWCYRPLVDCQVWRRYLPPTWRSIPSKRVQTWQMVWYKNFQSFYWKRVKV